MCHSTVEKAGGRGGIVDLRTYEHVVPGRTRQGSLAGGAEVGGPLLNTIPINQSQRAAIRQRSVCHYDQTSTPFIANPRARVGA
jgi:hypothetical protein